MSKEEQMSTTSSPPKIIFVDDEPRVLQGLRRMLRSFRKEWDLHFAEGGHQALSMMEESAADIVISDMRMPNMDGAELLQEVMHRYPSTVRIILSGQSDQLAMLKCMEPAHQFLTKPCNSEELKSVIQQTCRFRSQLEENDRWVQDIISRMTKLPCHPERKRALNETLMEEDPPIERLAEIISSDIGMSLKIIQLVSSSFLGPPQKEILPGMAVQLLGGSMMHSLESQTDVFDVMEEGNSLEDFERLTEHSLQVAAGARHVARELSADNAEENHAYLAGLFHVVDLMIRLAAPSMEKPPQTNSTGSLEPLLASSNAKASAYMLGLWGIPTPIVEAIAHYRNPINREPSDSIPLVGLHIAHAVIRRKDDPESLMEANYLNRLPRVLPPKEWIDLCRESLMEKVTP